MESMFDGLEGVGYQELKREEKSFLQRFFKRIRKRKLITACVAVILVLYGAGIVSQWVSPYSYREQNLERVTESPSRDHIFGTDRLGRDVFTRVLFSLRTTFIVTAAVVFTGGLVFGVGLGLLAGYKGGITDTIIMRVGETFSLIPGFLLLILISATVRPRWEEFVRGVADTTGMQFLVSEGISDFVLIFGALSLFYWLGTARLIRSQVLALREQDYILAARTLGASTPRILFRHLLPNLMGLILVGLTAGLGSIAGSEIALTFLGLGIQPPHPSFGAMIYDAGNIRTIQAYPHLLLIPGAVIALLMYAFNLLGDALIEMINPKKATR